MKLSSLAWAFLTAIVICIFPQFSFSLGSNWLWARTGAGTSTETGKGMVVDKNGNVLVTGFFQSNTIKFGSITLTNKNTNTTSDIFVVKYDPAGNVLWAKSAGSTDNDEAHGIATDNNGNVYITGWFFSQPISFGAISIPCVHTEDVFLAKYDSNGNVIWAKGAGGNSYDESNSVAVDKNGNVFITGFSSSTSFNFSPSINTGPGIFVAKYSNAGTVLWAKVQTAFSGAYFGGEGNSIAADAGGSVLLTGDFKGDSVTFGTFPLANADTSGMTSDIFIVKYDSSGTAVWAKNAGGKSDESGTSLCLDAGGNILVTGTFSSPTITFGSSALTNAGNNTDDIFVAKYNSSGNAVWAKGAGGGVQDRSMGVCTDVIGNVLVCGAFFSNTLTFDTTVLVNASNNAWDMFVVKYNPSGTRQFAYKVGAVSDELCNSIAADVNGDFYATGEFNSAAVSFGPVNLIDQNPGNSDVFVSKFSTTAGILELKNEIEVAVFPNPFTEQTAFIFGSTLKNAGVKIYDLSGKQVKNEIFSGSQVIMSKEGLKSGVYFYQVISEGKTVAAGKLIAE